MNINFALTNICLAIGLLLWLWFFPLESIRRDNFRNDIRRIRDRLFDFMWTNGYDFDRQSYRDVRQMLNGIIRLSNTISLPMFLMTMIYHRRAKGLDLAVESDDKLNARLQEAVNAASQRFIVFVFAEGVIWRVFRLALFGLRAGQFVESSKKLARKQARKFLASAYEFGSPMLNPQKMTILHGMKSGELLAAGDFSR